MGMEHAYIKWIRGKVVKTDEAGCCALVSRVSGGKSSENLLLTAEISFEKLMESCDEVIFKYCTRSKISRSEEMRQKNLKFINRAVIDQTFISTEPQLICLLGKTSKLLSWVGWGKNPWKSLVLIWFPIFIAEHGKELNFSRHSLRSFRAVEKSSVQRPNLWHEFVESQTWTRHGQIKNEKLGSGAIVERNHSGRS